ncbi:hypothetical protein H112_01737 [Trichophyton rubrum D6]|uniref:Early meiotic induction protein 1 n=5 Tax=Trichophyton TaxID=5550 RepID=A0A178EYC1_TRIRU|nr:uncharacterized protein TERG_06510 [Trichophyton rubrum CBS 118892]EZF26030.1 hypothetical protein H100_01733 [Trichophyton rubrum MR850]EZF45082.1 hypothetical protein H102_01725 [Trichophyton rubrum CBS 100081]EZF55748.1 hypothetical protein H103_01737 [Trichophyton rubrum CBS 288.86]EZF66355.1 hypothetical protein H104_01714 [Trichophyton rubrum CBS 289.86]EZF76996.1 hypothetical protein H105_01742 [Trichophyton soudanense CBS 452.61]EZF87535.1 hypothetical protein H110_01737 [Trichophy
MGWLWNSSGSATAEPLRKTEPSSPGNDSHSLPSNPATEQSTPQVRPLGRDEIAEAEFNELLRSLDNSTSSTEQHAPSTSKSRTSKPLPSQSIHFESPSTQFQSDSLYPKTMSCRTAFDYAYFCQSFGGQWVNVYRYGELRSCSEHWSDFWFCMRSKSLPDEEREKAISDRYRRKAIKYKTGPSSEDIWELRKEPVVGAFQGNYLAFEREMERLKQQENDARANGANAMEA